MSEMCIKVKRVRINGSHRCDTNSLLSRQFLYKGPSIFFLNSWKKMPKQLLVFLDSQLKNTDKIRTESQLEHFRILVCFSDNCFIYFFLKRIVLLHPFFKTYHLNIVDRSVLFIIKKLRVKKKKQVNFFSPSSSSYRRK